MIDPLPLFWAGLNEIFWNQQIIISSHKPQNWIVTLTLSFLPVQHPNCGLCSTSNKRFVDGYSCSTFFRGFNSTSIQKQGIVKKSEIVGLCEEIIICWFQNISLRPAQNKGRVCISGTLVIITMRIGQDPSMTRKHQSLDLWWCSWMSSTIF